MSTNVKALLLLIVTAFLGGFLGFYAADYLGAYINTLL